MPAEVQAKIGRGRAVVYVSGSIAAYKACSVVTGLRKENVETRVAMTRSAAKFVSAMTFQSLSGCAVSTSLWTDQPDQGPEDVDHGMAHIALSHWAEVQVAVPASADLIARLALGLADDVVSTTALACSAPLLVVPAMETGMWRHAATQEHLRTLQSRGAEILAPVSGRLASGHEGVGRMAEPAEVVGAVLSLLSRATSATGWLAGMRVVVTAGGTREPLDPVRYIGNRSSGKMGNALADEALHLGAEVILVTAAPPPAPRPGMTVICAETADDMLRRVRASVVGADVLVMAAAVADYRPSSPALGKIKKRDSALMLELVPTTDILRALGDDGSTRGVVVVGFAAETDDLETNARRKLDAKGLHLIVGNDVSRDGIGMGSDDNAVTIIGPQGVVGQVPKAPKPEVARAIFETIRPLLTR